VEPRAITWHFRSPAGGIRSHSDAGFWERDELIFNQRLREWGIYSEPVQPIVLDCGKGDHVIVRKLMPELKRKYSKIVLATCYPDVFEGEQQISIADARMRFGNLDRFNVYRFMIDEHWSGSLESAYRKLFHLEDSPCPVREEAASARTSISQGLSLLEGAYANAF
jgi:hypothetical protein